MNLKLQLKSEVSDQINQISPIEDDPHSITQNKVIFRILISFQINYISRMSRMIQNKASSWIARVTEQLDKH